MASKEEDKPPVPHDTPAESEADRVDRISDFDDIMTRLTGLPPEDAREVPFILDTPDKIAWAILKYLQYKPAILAIKAQAKGMVATIAKRQDRFKDRFWQELKDYAKTNIPKGKKSISFITGRLQFRQQKESFRIISEKHAMAWAEANAPWAIYQGPMLDKEALIDCWKTSGEIPAGCTAMAEREAFFIMPTGGKGKGARFAIDPFFNDDDAAEYAKDGEVLAEEDEVEGDAED